MTEKIKLPEPCVLYAVRNSKGQWFRSKGYGGYGETWVDDFGLAKMYHKLAQARGRVTFFNNNWPQYGPPQIVMFTITGGEVLGGEKERSDRLRKKRKEAEAKSRVRARKREVEDAQRELIEAQTRLAQLTGNPVPRT